MLKKLTGLIILCLFICSCKALQSDLSTLPNYSAINPNKIVFAMNNSNDSISFGFQYGLLNKKFTKKELEVGIKIVAVKIVNNSNSELHYNQDFEIVYKNDEKLIIATNSEYLHHFKQVGAHDILPTIFHFQILSAPILVNNILRARNTNKKIESEFEKNNIYNKTIKSKDTLYAIIPIKTKHFTPLKITL